MDPSMRNWGLAEAILDLETGMLSVPDLSLISVKEDDRKQVRQNSKDLEIAEQLSKAVLAAARRAQIVFVEVPVGSQSARAMASYGLCVGVLGAIRAEGIQLIEVTPTEVKLALTGIKHATKDQMIAAAKHIYPHANWPMHQGKPTSKAEHVADAIGAIYAGCKTPMFKNLLRILQPQGTNHP